MIHVWNRHKQREDIEQVLGDRWIRWAYGTPQGRFLTHHLLARKFVSQLMGLWNSTSRSAQGISSFIKDFHIPMEEFDTTTPYRTFNEFFIRRFKPDARPFTPAPHELPAPAEARYLAWDEISPSQTFPVKGQHLAANALLGKQYAEPFARGPLLLARLCPVDYHRFHFPDDGRILESYRQRGRLHSVNPWALAAKSDILCTNERHISILETKHFGLLAFIEVGALAVGHIVQSHDESKSFHRGEEKGYFLFGASTVIVMGQKGKWRPSEDLLANTKRGQETLVRLGECIAKG